MTKTLLALAALALVALTIACGGDDKTSTTVSPLGTKSGSPSASAAATPVGGNTAPDPANPTLHEALTEITSGDVVAQIDPGEIYPLDPQAVAQTAGSTPSCDNFQFDFTWQVQDPYPPDNVGFQWQIERAGVDVKVAEGPSGEQSIGCDTVDGVNTGAATISVAIKYKIGGLP